MKKLFFLFSFLAFIGVSNIALAQDTEVTHYNGQTKTFTVTNHAGFSYQWKVYSNVGLTTEVPSANFNISQNQTNSCIIEWKTMTEGTAYYVAVKEFAETSQQGCATTRYIKVNIAANQWDVVVIPVDENGAEVTELSVCGNGSDQTVPNDATLATPSNVRYYDVKILNGTTGWTGNWNFSYTLIGNDTQTTPVKYITAIESVAATGYFDPGINKTAEVTPAEEVAVTNGSKVRIKVTANNNAGTSPDFTYTLPLTVSNLKVGSGNVAEKTGNDANNIKTYTVKTYANTSAIIVTGN